MAKPQIKATPEIIKSLNKWKRQISKSGHHIPFVTVRAVNKIGRRHWVYCPRQKRQVHLLSDGEFRAYKLLLWQKGVISVEEQFALDVDETLDIAVDANLIHPRNWETSTAYVMSTDFLVTSKMEDGSIKRIAYTFKYWNQIFKRLDNGEVEQIKTRTWQKFAIERQYWHSRGIEYRVITELDTTKVCAWNIEYFELAHGLETSANELKKFVSAFVGVWSNAPRAELQELFKSIQHQINTSFQRTQSLFQYACLHHLLPINTDKYIRVFRSVDLKL
jgi:hypothetical protein